MAVKSNDSEVSAYIAFESLSSPLLFRGVPEKTISAYSIDDVAQIIKEAESLALSGLHVVGMLSYESAPAFDKKMKVRDRDAAERYPLALFHAYRADQVVENGRLLDDSTEAAFEVGAFEPSVDYTTYARAIDAVREEIRQGNTYQTNHTFRLRAPFSGNHFAFLDRLLRLQKAGYGAYFDAGRYKILSASPERFFRWTRGTGLEIGTRDGLAGSQVLANGAAARETGILETRPMKGTAPRGLSSKQDRANREHLKTSEKERAENLMIVDLLRNDLSRIAVRGTVEVPRLFSVEDFPTVWQMTSTVSCSTKPELSLMDLLSALFPCGSITGAPKHSTMRIIADLECSPRGVYCGSLLYLSPGLSLVEASVPIRTAVLDSEAGVIEYGVGGGITWDSTPQGEWEECEAKARVLHRACDAGFEKKEEVWELLETIRMEGSGEVLLMEGHLERLNESAEYFGVVVRRDSVRDAIEETQRKVGKDGLRVRMTVDRNGTVNVTTARLPPPFRTPRVVDLASKAIDQGEVWYYHKTTRRESYEAMKASVPTDAFDALLWNAWGEATEFTIGNLVVELPLGSAVDDGTETDEGTEGAPSEDGESEGTTEPDSDCSLSPMDPTTFPQPRSGFGLFTPPVDSGLLPGVFRGMLVDQEVVKERVIRVAELQGKRLWLTNAVRGFVEVELRGAGVEAADSGLDSIT